MKILIKRLLVSASIIMVPLFIPASVMAWDDCPRGKVNDPYPGDCARYIDTDGNGICDHSEPAPEDRVENIDNTVSEDVEPTAKKETDNVESVNTKTNSAEKDSSLSKSLLAVGIVIVNLAGILIYASYKNSKSS